MASSGIMPFWTNAGMQLGILKDEHESELDFCYRIMYSALSKWALTTVNAGGASISVTRIQQVVQNKYTAYSKILPTDAHHEDENIGEKVYQLLVNNGAFYHIQYFVRPTPYRLIECGEVSLIRGMHPEEKVCFSGFAPYVLLKSAETKMTDGFMLWPYDGETTIKMIWQRSLHVDSMLHIDEYLNLDRKQGRYYIPSKSDNRPYGLARSRQRGNVSAFDYYMIMDNEMRRIPTEYIDMQIQDHVRLALMNRVRKQSVSAIISKEIVLISTEYRLPSRDLSFIKYISWPNGADGFDSAFSFKIHPDIWPSLKDRFKFLGYEVNEEYE